MRRRRPYTTLGIRPDTKALLDGFRDPGDSYDRLLLKLMSVSKRRPRKGFEGYL